MNEPVLSSRFVLIRQLGVGGSGSVWLAQDRDTQRQVAVKVLAAAQARNNAAVQAMQRECNLAMSLRHANILQVAGLERSPSAVWMVMEFAAGGDLSQLRGASVVAVLRAVIPVADALAFAHDAGIVHRDLKPANVLLMADGTPRIADFGMALMLSETPAATVGRGSPYNMSPQQWAGDAAATADDIYAFGVLLYELFTGYPPFYPDISERRVRDETAPQLAANHLPPALSDLVSRCLNKQPEQRPASMRAIELELTALLSQLPTPDILSDASSPARPDIAPPAIRVPSHGEPLRGAWQRPTASADDAAEQRRQGFRRGLFAAALVLGVIAIVVVFIALPKWVAAPSPEPQAAARSAVTPAVEVEKKALDFAALAQAKQAAEELRAPLDERLKKLQARAADKWAAEDFARAAATLAAADKQFEAREYPLAVEQLALLEPLLVQLEKQAPEVLAAQLKAGATAINEGRSADARDAFTLAQLLDAKNAATIAGLKRAATLDEVLKVLAAAELAEKDGDVAAATIGYRKALTLDAQTTRASEGLARTQSRIAGNAFASAMAQGFSALTRADYATARSNFDAAGKVRPGAAEVTQALKQVEQEERTRMIGARLETARQFESQEKWTEALQEYQGVAQLDSTVTSASDGITRTRPRADLNQQLEVYLTQPERLFSTPVRNAAKENLQRAQTIASPGPVLTKQMATLSQWLARAEVPVPVALQSDNVTHVTIRRISDLGAFEQRSLELAPGSYTIVGTRPGYRDVRREITVLPGAAPAPVIIRCEEKI